MLYRRSDKPREKDIVLCKVTKIFHSSVFVDLLEWDRMSGMVHISEIAPGRIRNLRDYVKEGKQIICTILRINKERGHIDLSLRRVGSNNQRQKLDEIKQELKAEKVISKLATDNKQKPEALYKKIAPKLLEHYDYVHEAFKDVVAGETTLEELGVGKDIAEKLTRAVQDRFKEPIAVLKGTITLKTYHEDGVSEIQKIIKEVEKVRSDIEIKYMGAGKYAFSFKDKDIKNAEDDISKMEELVAAFADGKTSHSGFERERAELQEE